MGGKIWYFWCSNLCSKLAAPHLSEVDASGGLVTRACSSKAAPVPRDEWYVDLVQVLPGSDGDITI